MLHGAECGGSTSGSSSRPARLLAAMRTVCRVLDVPELKQEEAARSLRCLGTEAQAGRSWAERVSDWGRFCGTPDDLLHYHSDADADGVTATQEIEFARVAGDSDEGGGGGGAGGGGADADAVSLCLEDGDSGGEEEEAEEEAAAVAVAVPAADPELQYQCYIWFLYTRAQSPYKAGLIYSPDTGSWTQFVTAREPWAQAERLVATHSDAFNPACPHLISGLRRLLLNLKYLVLRLQR